MAKLEPEDRARLDAFKDVIVKHAHLQEVDDQLALWVEEHTDSPERRPTALSFPSSFWSRFRQIRDSTFGSITTGKSSMPSKSTCWSKNFWEVWPTSWPHPKRPAPNWAPSIGSRCA